MDKREEMNNSLDNKETNDNVNTDETVNVSEPVDSTQSDNVDVTEGHSEHEESETKVEQVVEESSVQPQQTNEHHEEFMIKPSSMKSTSQTSARTERSSERKPREKKMSGFNIKEKVVDIALLVISALMLLVGILFTYKFFKYNSFAQSSMTDSGNELKMIGTIANFYKTSTFFVVMGVLGLGVSIIDSVKNKKASVSGITLIFSSMLTFIVAFVTRPFAYVSKAVSKIMKVGSDLSGLLSLDETKLEAAGNAIDHGTFTYVYIILAIILILLVVTVIVAALKLAKNETVEKTVQQPAMTSSDDNMTEHVHGTIPQTQTQEPKKSHTKLIVLIISAVVVVALVIGGIFIFKGSNNGRAIDLIELAEISCHGAEGADGYCSVGLDFDKVDDFDPEISSFLIWNVDYELDLPKNHRDSDFENGEEISVIAKYNEAEFKAEGLKVINNEGTFTVSGLTDSPTSLDDISNLDAIKKELSRSFEYFVTDLKLDKDDSKYTYERNDSLTFFLDGETVNELEDKLYDFDSDFLMIGGASVIRIEEIIEKKDGKEVEKLYGISYAYGIGCDDGDCDVTYENSDYDDYAKVFEIDSKKIKSIDDVLVRMHIQEDDIIVIKD